MEQHIKWLTLFGKISLCYPISDCPAFVSSKGLRKFLEKFNIPCILQLSLSLVSVAFAIDNTLSNPPERQIYSSHLSDQIYFYICYAAAVTSDTVIRLTTVYYWTPIPATIAEIAELKAFSKTFFISRSQKFTNRLQMVALLIAIAFVVFGFYVGVDDMGYGGHFVEEYTYHVIPRNEMFARSFFVLIDLMPFLSFAFAILFIVVIGTALIELHSAFIENFEQEILHRKQESRARTTVAIVDKTFQKYTSIHVSINEEEFMEKFIQLQKVFTMFTKIGGNYAFGITVMATLICIRAAGVLSGISVWKSFNEPTYREFNFLNNAVALVFLASFGTFMTSKVMTLSVYQYVNNRFETYFYMC